jgi:hypothetical protein
MARHSRNNSVTSLWHGQFIDLSFDLSKSITPLHRPPIRCDTVIHRSGFTSRPRPRHVRLLARTRVRPSLSILRRPRRNCWTCERLAARWVRFHLGHRLQGWNRGQDATDGSEQRPHAGATGRPAPNSIPDSDGLADSSFARIVRGIGFVGCAVGTSALLGGSGNPTRSVAFPAPGTARPAEASNARREGRGMRPLP